MPPPEGSEDAGWEAHGANGKGESLAASLPILLAQVERTLVAPEPFDPATTTRSFRLAAPDFVSPLVPHFLKAVTQEAPGVSIEIAAFSPAAALDTLQGRFDALIAPSFKQSDDLRGAALGSWPWVTYGRNDHPAFADGLCKTGRATRIFRSVQPLRQGAIQSTVLHQSSD